MGERGSLSCAPKIGNACSSSIYNTPTVSICRKFTNNYKRGWYWHRAAKFDHRRLIFLDSVGGQHHYDPTLRARNKG